LIVTDVKEDTEAAQAGLEEGDVIESAAGVVLESADQLAAILEEGKKRRQAVRVTVRRGNARMLMVVR
jgi:serine protease Do